MISEKNDPQLFFFHVEATNGEITGSYPAAITEYDEVAGRRWIISHFLKSGWRCLKLTRITDPEELIDATPIMPHNPGEND